MSIPTEEQIRNWGNPTGLPTGPAQHAQPAAYEQNVSIPKMFINDQVVRIETVKIRTFNHIEMTGMKYQASSHFKFICLSIKTTAFGTSYQNVLWIG